jgi:hypothetical protein
MLGTGLTFATGVGLLSSAIGAVAMLAGKRTFIDLLRTAGRLSVVSFILGVGFAGVLAIAARRRSFEKLTLGFVTSLGAGAGFLYFLFISISGSRVWTLPVALLNFSLLMVLGSGSAAATFLLARTAGRALKSGESAPELGEGSARQPTTQRDNERVARS